MEVLRSRLLGHDFDSGTNYEIILTVTDSDGLQHRSSVFIDPELVNVTFNSIPAGLTLSIGGIDQTAPVTRECARWFPLHDFRAESTSGWKPIQLHFLVRWRSSDPRHHRASDGADVHGNLRSRLLHPPPNQVTALSFSEGSGTAAADNSGSGHDGTLVNGPTWTAGKFGNGLSLDGANDYRLGGQSGHS